MIQIDVRQLQIELDQCLDRVAQGETILVSKDSEPIAEIKPVTPGSQTPRPFGLAQGRVEIKPSFFEPLPEDVLAAFEGNPG